MTDRCICCGAQVPEGRQVCPDCYVGVEAHGHTCAIMGESCICNRCEHGTYDSACCAHKINMSCPVVACPDFVRQTKEVKNDAKD